MSSKAHSCDFRDQLDSFLGDLDVIVSYGPGGREKLRVLSIYVGDRGEICVDVEKPRA